VIFNPPPRPPRSTGGLEYRLYFLDDAGHIEKLHEFEAENDEKAIRISQGWREGRRMEFWQRGRLVAHRD
jgi:hypothetical protein